MHSLEKTEYEELWRYHNFRRNIANEGWLPAGVTLSSIDIVMEDSSGATCTSSMLSSVSVFSESKVQYFLKGGTQGQKYTMNLKAIGSDGQKYEDRIIVTIT